MITYDDAVNHVIDYLGGSGGNDGAVRDARRAVLAALDELTTARNWTYLYRHGRVFCHGIFGTGCTVTYAASAKTVTLAGGVWPAWAEGSYLRVGSVNWRIERVVDATTAVLDAEVNPGGDVTAPATFTMYQDGLRLPDDFWSADQALMEVMIGSMAYASPGEWLFGGRYSLYAGGQPTHYTILADPTLPGRLLFRVFPYPTTAQTIDFIYKRRPRRPRITELAIASATAAAGSTALTTASPVFDPSHVGSVLRLGTGPKPPTSLIASGPDANPFAFEGTIRVVNSSTSVTLYDAPTLDLSAVAATLSDPIDVDPVMANAFYRCCEKHVGMGRSLKDRPSASRLYTEAFDLAACSDSRSFARRAEDAADPYRDRHVPRRGIFLNDNGLT